MNKLNKSDSDGLLNETTTTTQLQTTDTNLIENYIKQIEDLRLVPLYFLLLKMKFHIVFYYNFSYCRDGVWRRNLTFIARNLNNY